MTILEIAFSQKKTVSHRSIISLRKQSFFGIVLSPVEENKGKVGGSVNHGVVWRLSQMQTDDAAKVIAEGSRHGKNHVKFTWKREFYGARPGISENTSKKAMLFAPRESTKAVNGQYRFYRFSFWLPDSPDGRGDTKNQLIVQWQASRDRLRNGELGEPARFPPLSIHVIRGRLKLRGFYQQERYSGDEIIAFTEVDLGAARNTVDNKTKRWVDLQARIRFDCCSQNPSGSVEIWRKDIGEAGALRKVANVRNVRLGYNDNFYPFLGVGIYQYSETSDFPETVNHFDNVKVGNEKTTFGDLK
ncbi:MAG: heparin lyase I family protein [Pseudobacteriovorax sp.]|nr:heparin lyase I family protein [Pseudobacteriovorax sp.]